MIYDEWVFHDVEHIYLQLIKKIRCAIYSGQLSAGEKFPSVREMAKILHINPNTVMRAYKIVSNDKLIVSYRNGQYSVTTDEQYIAKKREDTAKVLCFSYFDNMFALGFSKDEAIRFIQDYSERLKIQTNLG